MTTNVFDALKSCEAWLSTWAQHVGNCRGGNRCACGLEAILHEARAAISETLEIDEWQPIETAPYNQLVLIANSGWGYVDRQIACRRDYAESGWVDQNAQPIPVDAKPTHWMALAPAPEPPGNPRVKTP